MKMSSPVGPPASAPDYAAGAIRDGITTGRYPLGSRLDQNALAGELGISTIPVREALRQLEAEGLVEISPRRGAFVATISTDEMIEIYKIREALDSLAISEAVPNLTDADLRRVGSILEEMEQSTAAHDMARTLVLNRQFHGEIYAAGGMPRLLQMIANLTDRYSIYNKVYIPRHSEHSTHEHRAIFEACRDRDVARAVELTRDHLRRARQQMIDTLEAGL
jgi:DNA-binding GntR family transcriptional regulator